MNIQEVIVTYWTFECPASNIHFVTIFTPVGRHQLLWQTKYKQRLLYHNSRSNPGQRCSSQVELVSNQVKIILSQLEIIYSFDSGENYAFPCCSTFNPGYN